MIKDVKPENARQGGNSRRVLFVLIGALILAVVAWVIADSYFFQIAPENPSKAEKSGAQMSPQQHLDNPSTATPQQTKPAPTNKAKVPNPPDAAPSGN